MGFNESGHFKELKFTVHWFNVIFLFYWIIQEARRTQTIHGRMNVGRVVKTWTSHSGYPLVQVNWENGLIFMNQVSHRLKKNELFTFILILNIDKIIYLIFRPHFLNQISHQRITRQWLINLHGGFHLLWQTLNLSNFIIPKLCGCRFNFFRALA